MKRRTRNFPRHRARAREADNSGQMDLPLQWLSLVQCSDASSKRLEFHHLTYEPSKNRWVLRLTVDMGPKVVGKRLRINLGRTTSEIAKAQREAVYRAYEVVGLTVRDRVMRPRKQVSPETGNPAPEQSPITTQTKPTNEQ